MKDLIKLIPNILTCSRILLALVFPFLIKNQLTGNIETAAFLWTFLLFLLICFTDLFDGKLARSFHAVTKLGGILDVSADMLYILLSSLVLNILKIIPIWFSVVIVLNFVEFLVTSHIITKQSSTNKAFVFDWFGRISAVLFYLLPGIVSALFFCFHPLCVWILDAILILNTFLAFVSCVYRCAVSIQTVLHKKADEAKKHFAPLPHPLNLQPIHKKSGLFFK